MSFGFKKNKDKIASKNVDCNNLLDCEIVKNIVAKIHIMSQYNDDLTMALANSKIQAKIDIAIKNDKVITNLRNITFTGPGPIKNDNSKRNSDNDKYRLIVSSTCIMFFNGEYYKRLFIYDGWKGLLSL